MTQLQTIDPRSPTWKAEAAAEVRLWQGFGARSLVIDSYDIPKLFYVDTRTLSFRLEPPGAFHLYNVQVR